MSNIVIKVENLSKQYRLGEVGTGSMRDDFKRFRYRMMGKDDPFLTIGEENNRNTQSQSDYVWALKDINFEVNQGDVVGVIGSNGAGKSTLLKILSRTTGPTTGSVKMKGRIASLLEVGTGFHAELSGRENIYLNGAIMGLRKHEVKAKLDEIIAFAGVERYIDTPVKRYSSGMYVRLAFAVAAHLEPDIMIVDEVLAVGDAEFQKKALGKMKDVSESDGRTVLFVSHNLLAVKSLCTSGILLHNGIIESFGKINQIIEKYTAANNKFSSFSIIKKEANSFTVHSITTSNNGIDGCFNIENKLEITIEVSSNKNHNSININLFFKTKEGTLIFATCSNTEEFEQGKATYTCIVPAKTLNDNVYIIDLMIVDNGENVILNIKDVLTIQGIEGKRIGSWLGKFPGLIRPQYFEWNKL